MLTTANNEIAQIGDNLPPSEIELLQARLKDEHATVLSNAQKLIEAGERMPERIDDEVTAAKAIDFIKKINLAKKDLEATRVKEKSPYDNLAAAVHTVFKRPFDALAIAATKANTPLDNYNKRKAAAERQRLLDEANIRREEEDLQRKNAEIMRAAEQKEIATDLDTAANISAQQATKLETQATAKAATLITTRSDSGAQATLRTEWEGTLQDVAALDLEVLRHHIKPEAYEMAIRSFVRAGGRVLAGALIVEKETTVVR